MQQMEDRSPGDRRLVSSGDAAVQHLASFLMVAEERHFARAAKRLSLTQPTLSRRIRLLEKELGIELFDRASRPIGLTAAGTAFLADATIALHYSRRALEQGRRAARGEVGHVAIGAISWANNAILPDALRAFRARAPHVTLELYTTGPGYQAEALQSRRLDVGFTAFARWLTGRPALHVEPLLEEPMVAILPRDHRLAGADVVALADLAGERLVTLADSVAPGLVDKQIAMFHEQGLSPTNIQEAPDPWAVMTLIAGGVGVGLHMASFSNVRHRGLAFVPLKDKHSTATLFMLSRRDEEQEAVRVFLQTTRDVARSLDPADVFAGP